MTENVRRSSAGGRKIKRRRVQGAALSGGALIAGQLAGAMPSHAAGFIVTNLNDSGAGSLRQAILAANAAGSVDTITFQAGLTGTIQLVGELDISDDVTITGPGAAAITVDAQGNSVVFDVYNPVDNIVVTISGLTVTGGYGFGNGGGITTDGENLTLADMVITENLGAEGGGVFARDAILTISDSTISENTALYGAGGGVFSDSTILTITGTQFIHNSVEEGFGGGLAVGGEGGSATITGSVFDDNQAGAGAGIGLNAKNTPVAIVDTTLTGNDASFVGGGLAMGMSNDDPADLVTITDSTISGNTAAYGGGGGIFFYGPYDASSRLRVDRSTISGNDGGEGGGVLIRNSSHDYFGDYDVTHSVTISDSTISGNRALGLDRPGPYYDLLAAGGGVFVAMQDNDAYGGVDTLAVTLANSTIAGNTGAEGGGVYEHIFNDAVITLDHTIVGDNTAASLGPDIRGSVDANWSLVENTGAASLTGANNVTGADPQLSPLADNGGPTLTQMIAPTSPAHNAGNPAFGTTPAVDQRGRPRISGTKIDIGAVERQTSLPAVVNTSVNWKLRDRLSTGPPNLPTFTLGTTPLVPIMGDWDGDGDKTPGYFKGGVFTLSNNLDGTGTPVTFTFGDSRGFPVAGNWDGDADDEVAVFRNGVFDVRPNTNLTATSTLVSLGSGVWPATVPVAGDWDGIGPDGIGVYNGNGAGVGTWTLRQTATTGGTNVPPFNFEAAQPGYPVVGDWDGDGFDTLGTKTGATWSLSNTHVGTPPVVDPLYVFDFSTATPAQDLPLVWRYGTGP